MYVAPNCSCGGGPFIEVVRGDRVMCFKLDWEDKVALKKGDVIFASCDTCGVALELKESNAIGASA